MVAQIIECYQFSCHFAVTQKRKEQKMALLLSNKPYQNNPKGLWNDKQSISLSGFQNVGSTKQIFHYRLELVDESQLKEA